ncbi:MAG: HAD-IA family hydrolase [Candidatus Altiarchaeota archaeon]|nr:HAD-IA family hydrolase [Candidatus Altiarchaeota archaeon]
MESTRIILWDIDGVLIYVGESYRQTIINTVQHYFSEFIGLRLPDKLMTWKDTQGFKFAGGFNDDWELTYAAVLCYLSELVCRVDVSKLAVDRPQDLDGMLSVLKNLGSVCGDCSLSLDLKPILKKLKEYGGGLSALDKALPEFFGDYVGKARDFWFPELVKRLFEEVYLGEELFREKYGVGRRFAVGEGRILKETSLVDIETLLEFRKNYYFGIVTGRERFEAEFSLRQHLLHRVFPPELIVAREDIEERKPSPQPLIECSELVRKKYALSKNTGVIYVGDSLDDLAAARNAGFYFIAVVGGIKDLKERNNLRREMHERICDLIVDDVQELFLYL